MTWFIRMNRPPHDKTEANPGHLMMTQWQVQPPGTSVSTCAATLTLHAVMLKQAGKQMGKGLNGMPPAMPLAWHGGVASCRPRMVSDELEDLTLRVKVDRHANGVIEPSHLVKVMAPSSAVLSFACLTSCPCLPLLYWPQ
jgi:hypothetical protein